MQDNFKQALNQAPGVKLELNPLTGEWEQAADMPAVKPENLNLRPTENQLKKGPQTQGASGGAFAWIQPLPETVSDWGNRSTAEIEAEAQRQLALSKLEAARFRRGLVWWGYGVAAVTVAGVAWMVIEGVGSFISIISEAVANIVSWLLYIVCGVAGLYFVVIVLKNAVAKKRQDNVINTNSGQTNTGQTSGSNGQNNGGFSVNFFNQVAGQDGQNKINNF